MATMDITTFVFAKAIKIAIFDWIGTLDNIGEDDLQCLLRSYHRAGYVTVLHSSYAAIPANARYTFCYHENKKSLVELVTLYGNRRESMWNGSYPVFYDRPKDTRVVEILVFDDDYDADYLKSELQNRLEKEAGCAVKLLWPKDVTTYLSGG